MSVTSYGPVFCTVRGDVLPLHTVLFLPPAIKISWSPSAVCICYGRVKVTKQTTVSPDQSKTTNTFIISEFFEHQRKSEAWKYLERNFFKPRKPSTRVSSSYTWTLLYSRRYLWASLLFFFRHSSGRPPLAYNRLDGEYYVNRASHMGPYRVVDGLPL